MPPRWQQCAVAFQEILWFSYRCRCLYNLVLIISRQLLC